MPLIPCICGPLGILPLRLRCRVLCKITHNQLTLTAANETAGTTARTPEELTLLLTPRQCLRILARANGLTYRTTK